MIFKDSERSQRLLVNWISSLRWRSFFCQVCSIVVNICTKAIHRLKVEVQGGLVVLNHEVDIRDTYETISSCPFDKLKQAALFDVPSGSIEGNKISTVELKIEDSCSVSAPYRGAGCSRTSGERRSPKG